MKLDEIDLQEIRDLAVDICQQAGARLRAAFANPCVLEAVLPHDLKARADKETEAFIRQKLALHRPQDNIIGEEEGGYIVSKEANWIVDPIDGTINFAHHDPYFATTLAWAYGGQTLVGVIYAPIFDLTYSAVMGHGAYCNGRRLSVSQTPSLSTALINVGLGKGDDYLKHWNLLSPLVQRVNNTRLKCCATLDLCAVASGRSDGYADMGLYLWDFAAGALILEEAGGKFKFTPGIDPDSFDCVAANPNLFDEVCNLLSIQPTNI